MRNFSDRNASTEVGRHGEGSGLGVRVGPKHGKGRVSSGQAPTTGKKRSFDGLHPERVKELKNMGEPAGEGQMGQQVSEEAQPFNGSLSELEAPETASDDELNTMPEDNPPAGVEHTNEPHEARIPRKRLGAVTHGHVPEADAHSGGMHLRPQRGGGGSAFYGD